MIIQNLNERLNTNCVPTAAESHLLRKELTSSFQLLKQIQTKVDVLEHRLEELNRQRVVLDAKVVAYKGMFSPARRLLPDILQEIFVHCLPSTTNPVMTKSEPPLVLGRVCSQWRYIAYTTPALWSAIHIAVPLDSPFIGTCNHAVRAQAILSWLSRAGIRPLSISLSAPHSWTPENQARDPTVKLFLDTIGPYIVRCKSIHISFRNHIWQYFLETYFQDAFPFLTHLNLDAGMSHWANDDISSKLKQAPLGKAPKLRMVSLMHYGSQAIHLALPWRQLTFLKLCDEISLAGWDPGRAFLMPDALLFLSWCPSLVFCSLSLSEAGTSQSSGLTSSAMVTLPDLIGFSVQCDADPKLFFARLSAPSLRYIHYRQEVPRWPGAELDGADRALHVALRPFIQRVVQPIEELQIVATYLTEDDIILCLELFPGLKRLSLSSFGSAFDPPNAAPIPPPWDEVNRTSITGRILNRFMRRVNLSDNPCEDTVIEEIPQLLDEQDSDDEEYFGPSTPSTPCLCPKLENLSIKGASFPDTMLLSFIRFRVLSYAQYGVSRIIWLSIMFPLGREEPPEILDDVQDLQDRSGTHINVHYSGHYLFPEYRFSPYNGLASVDSNGDPTNVFIPSFGLALTTN